MGRTILIDADILAYQIASSLEVVHQFGDQKVYTGDEEKASAELENAIGYILEMTDSDQAALFLTGTKNFRKEVLPTYKANRLDVRKPHLLPFLRQHMQDEYKLCFIEDKLEGDDLLGIHATMPHKGERVIYSADKDLKQIPALHWDGDDGEVVEVSQEEGDHFFYTQILTGDPTDNYSGCPKVGPVGAAELIGPVGNAFMDHGVFWVRTERILRSGPNKGKTRVEFVKKEGPADPWGSILSAYRKAGLREDDAIQQARCARILRHGEYDFEKQEVKLWEPN